MDKCWPVWETCHRFTTDRADDRKFLFDPIRKVCNAICFQQQRGGEGGGRDELVAFPLFTTRVSFLNKEFRARLEFDSVRCKCDRYCLRFR